MFRIAVLVTAALLSIGLPAQGRSYAPHAVLEAGRFRIDGVLDEAEWSQAKDLSPLTQVNPVEGREPSRKTRVRICYDASTIYLAFECFDEKKNVRARILQRDARLDPDDRVEFWLDTYDDKRFAYWFQIGAAGSWGDALLADGGNRFSKAWDGIWYAKARVTDRGWQAEIAIPLATMGFKKSATSWGFNLRRIRKADQSSNRWATPRQGQRFFKLAVGGRLTGLHGLKASTGIEFRPYLKGRAQRERAERSDWNTQGDFGFDLGYRLTPELQLQLTYNTDFAETEVDERVVNLTRFPVFFPEKRDFFLEDAGIFEFGSPDLRRRVLPYYSRRIGLASDGEIVPILGGGRITGRTGGWNLSTLGVVTDATGQEEEKGLGVFRVVRNLGLESTVGFLGTMGRPEGGGSASTWGFDTHLANSTAFGDGSGWNFWAWGSGTQRAEPGGDGMAYGAQGEYFSREWVSRLSFREIDPDYRPELGFARRVDERNIRYLLRYRLRFDEGPLRFISWRLAPEGTWLTSGEIDSWRVPLRILEVEMTTEDAIEYNITKSFERIQDPFAIHPGIDIAPGDYDALRHNLEFRFSDKRPVSGEIRLTVGDLYSGTFTRTSVEPLWIPFPLLVLGGNWEHVSADLLEGSFGLDLYEVRVDLQFTTHISWNNFVQYDTTSKDLGLQSRFRWILEPGNDLFLLASFGWNKFDDNAPLTPTNQDVILKLVWTFRF